jgi:N-acetylmuramic acid 6-phosphate etherase
MRERPITESENPASARLDELPTRELVALMNAEDARVAPAVAAELDAIARAVDAIVERMKAGGRLIHLGAGTSGRLGVLDAVECPPTFGTPSELVVGLIAGGDEALVRAHEGAEDRRELALSDLARARFSAKDALVAISASGRTPYALAAVERALELGALAIGVSCDPGSPLSRAATIAITPVPGPEVVTGSTRLKAGTATKLVLNMLSTASMVRLGHVRGNLMVDLRAGSAKLEGRAAGIVMKLADIDEVRARELLAQHGGLVRAAVAAAKGEKPLASPARAGGAALVMGIDGGGTKCAARLSAAPPAAPDRALGEGSGGPCNLSGDFESSCSSLERAVGEAFTRAGLARMPVDALCVAAAGAGDAALRDRLRSRLLSRRFAPKIAIVHDAAPLLAAATDGAGVALIAGTGSFCFGRDESGRGARSGGLGPLVGDEGSAFSLGRAALVAAARAADGRGAALRLVKAVYAELGTSDARTLAGWARSVEREPARVAALAPLVSAAADEGDPVALRILERAAAELALLVKTVVLRLRLPREKLPLVLAGGVLDASERQRKAVVSSLRSIGVAVDVQPAPSALAGAVALARSLHDGRFDEKSWFPP